MIKNKKGFTLVELLAVIVVLAVVILIAVTAVIPRMNKAKKKAFYDEALIYFNSVNDVAVVNEGNDCFNISDLDEYIKQSKDGYSGTLYVNEEGKKTLNITNGKYYLVASDLNPSESDIKESKPTNFVSTCSDTSKTYTITYDLGGGTLSAANPSSYTPNTATFTLNNPTKSGYRFVGWSSQNLLDIYHRTEGTLSGMYNNTVRNFDTDKYYVGMSSNNYYVPSNIPTAILTSYWTIVSTGGGYGVAFPVKVKPNTTYYISNLSNNGIALGYFTGEGVFISYAAAPNSGLYGAITTPSDCEIINIVLKPGTLNKETKYYGVQFELGSSATDYQEYMAPTINAKVYRGSTGNRKYVANWEAI